MSQGGEHTFLWQLMLAERQGSRAIEAALRAENIDVEQWRALSFLRLGEGKAMGELSSGLALSTSTTTKVIDRLVSNALVYRAPDEADRRKTLIFISEIGLNIVKRMGPIVAGYENVAIERIATSDEFRTLATTLGQPLARTK